MFRCPGVQATTMPEGNDREHDGQYRQGHGFGGEDAPARRAHGEIVLTPGRGVKAAMNVPAMPRQVCPGTPLAGLVVAAKQTQTHAIHVLHERAGCMPWSRFPGQGRAKWRVCPGQPLGERWPTVSRCGPDKCSCQEQPCPSARRGPRLIDRIPVVHGGRTRLGGASQRAAAVRGRCEGHRGADPL